MSDSFEAKTVIFCIYGLSVFLSVSDRITLPPFVAVGKGKGKIHPRTSHDPERVGTRGVALLFL